MSDNNGGALEVGWQQLIECDPIFAQQAREAATRYLNPPAPGEISAEPPRDQRPSNTGLFDTPEMPPLPECARIDPVLGQQVGGWVDSYVDYAHCVSPMTPDSFHTSAALVLAAVAIARRLVLPMPFGDIYPNLFVLWLATTTLYRKSTALMVARNLARDAFTFLLAAQDTTPEAFLSDMAGMQPTNYASLPLLEQDAWAQERNYSAQKGLFLDELSGLMAGAGKDYNAGLLESFLRFYDCDPLFTRSTSGKGRIVVKNAYLSMLGASTPGAMVQHLAANTLWSNGWWARFAILTPEKRPEWRDAEEKDRPPELVSTLKRLLERLPNGHKWPEPPPALAVTIAPEAFSAWSKYNKALSYDLLQENLSDQLHGAYGRLPVQALKIAMILAALDWPQEYSSPRIELAHIARSIEITESWRASVHRALATIAENEMSRTYERIIYQVQRLEPNGASVRDVYKAMKDKRPSEIEAAMLEMVMAGLLEEIPEGGEKRGRPTKKYRLPRD